MILPFLFAIEHLALTVRRRRRSLNFVVVVAADAVR